jgi:hypothetical protein
MIPYRLKNTITEGIYDELKRYSKNCFVWHLPPPPLHTHTHKFFGPQNVMPNVYRRTSSWTDLTQFVTRYPVLFSMVLYIMTLHNKLHT